MASDLVGRPCLPFIIMVESLALTVKLGKVVAGELNVIIWYKVDIDALSSAHLGERV